MVELLLVGLAAGVSMLAAGVSWYFARNAEAMEIKMRTESMSSRLWYTKFDLQRREWERQFYGEGVDRTELQREEDASEGRIVKFVDAYIRSKHAQRAGVTRCFEAGITGLATEEELEKGIELIIATRGLNPFGSHAPFLEGLPKLEVLTEYKKLQTELKNKAPDLFTFLNDKREENKLERLQHA